MSDEREEWDGPWKEALDDLPSVFALFWPDVPRAVDLSKGFTPLQQELQKIAPSSNSALLRVDKLFEMQAHETGDPRYAHFEAQMQKDAELPSRMFKYGRRGGDFFNQPVGRFAILGDDDPEWKPTEYTEGVLGCSDTLTFRIVKLIEWRSRMVELEAGENLFGLFVGAHLETMGSRGDVPRRAEAKFRLLANLLRRDLIENELRRWYRLIDWIMKLPEDVDRDVWRRLQEIKEPNPMSYVTFAERYGHEKGLKEGRDEGLKAGRDEGLKEGRSEGLKDALREALEAKFAQDGAALFAAFKDVQDVERLKSLLRTTVLASSPDDFRARAAAP